MKELDTIQFNQNTIVLKDNLVKGAILPKVFTELERSITIQSNTRVEGAIHAHKLEIENGNVEIGGAVFTQLELHINSNAEGQAIFRKSVASADSVVSYASKCRGLFMADINAKQVKLCNAFVAGSIFADEIILKNCIVIGGVFATAKADLDNCIVGTFNSPSVSLSGEISLLLPSAFSVEKIFYVPDTTLYNLTLADLGALYKGEEEMKNSGRIRMDLTHDELQTVLSSEDSQQSIRTYTVVGKVLAADLLDANKLENHFLISAASLGSQLLKTYNWGVDEHGEPLPLTQERISNFFFELLSGKKVPQPLDGTFSIQEMMEKYS